MYNIIFFYCSSNIQDNINKLSHLYNFYQKISYTVNDIFIFNGTDIDIKNILSIIEKNYGVLYKKCFVMLANDFIDMVINLNKFLGNIVNNNYELFIIEENHRIDRIKYIYIFCSKFFRISYDITYIEIDIKSRDYPLLCSNVYMIEKFIQNNMDYYNTYMLNKVQNFFNNK